MPLKKMYIKKIPQTNTEIKKQRAINTLNTPFLVIVESPSKCAKIENYLGFQYKCIASKGHIREIKKISKENYNPVFEIIPEKESHVSEMRTIISQFKPENIYLASDDDREGEAISWHICQVFGLSIENTHRILFHEITETALQKAIKHPIKIRMNIVYSQLARQVLDRLVGFQISPILSKRLVHGGNSYLSAGRCQTPALRIIYEKEMQEKNTDSVIKYKTCASFFSPFPSFEFQLNHDFENSEECISFLEETNTFSHELVKGKDKSSDKGSETKILERKSRSLEPPKPFNTSNLLQSVSNSLHYSPKQTMSYCQTLYQGGFITYMRTDSQKYANQFLSQMKDFIIKEYGEKGEISKLSVGELGDTELSNESYLGDFSQIENTDSIINPHEAIRVTNINIRTIECDNNTDTRINTLYKHIWKNTLASCMSNYDYSQIDLQITAPKTHKYETKLEIPQFLGWKRVYTEEKEHRETLEKQNQLYLYLQQQYLCKKSVNPIKIKMTLHMMEKTRHYTEAGLIKKLEEYGIGRPSTYALLVDTIQDRGYVTKQDIIGEKTKGTEYEWHNGKMNSTKIEKKFGNEKNKLVLQELGKQAIDFLIPNYTTLFSYDYTKHLEERLDEIARENGCDIKWYEICKDCEEEIKKCSKSIKEEMKEEYIIDESHIFIFGKSGGVIKHTRMDGTFEYKPVKKDEPIDMIKLKEQKYTLVDLLELPHSHLGNYEGFEMYLKTGPYGPYVEWGNKKESIKRLIGKTIQLKDITMEIVLDYLEKKSENGDNGTGDGNTIRILRPDLSIKNGKYGPYLYYLSENGKTSCYSLKKFRGGYKTGEPETIIQWMTETYGVL